MAKIVVLGKELEGDFFDADFMERYETATKDMHNVATDARDRKYEKVADAFREQCTVAREYFDAVFGEGTSYELFGDKLNLRTHIEAIAELTDCAAGAKKEINDLTNKYTQRSKSFSQVVSAKKH